VRHFLTILGIAAPIWGASSASFDSYTWKGTAPTSIWDLAGNWSASPGAPPPRIPTSADYAILDSLSALPDGGQITVDLGSSATALVVFFTSPSVSYTLGTGEVGSQTFSFGSASGFNVTSSNLRDQFVNANIQLGVPEATGSFLFANYSSQSNLSIAGNIHSVSTGSLTFTGSSTGSGEIRISGSISGPLSLQISSGRVTLSGNNTYTGGTSITGGRLTLGSSNVLDDAGMLTLATGTFATGGFSETLGSLKLSNDTTIDFGIGSSALTFADSSAISWTGTLTLSNFDIGTDVLKFGSTGTALTPSQLSQISLPGYQAELGSDGIVSFVAVPEPTTGSLIILTGILGVTAVTGKLRSRS
jgi:autotransporter-associated beta strand protein